MQSTVFFQWKKREKDSCHIQPVSQREITHSPVFHFHPIVLNLFYLLYFSSSSSMCLLPSVTCTVNALSFKEKKKRREKSKKRRKTKRNEKKDTAYTHLLTCHDVSRLHVCIAICSFLQLMYLHWTHFPAAIRFNKKKRRRRRRRSLFPCTLQLLFLYSILLLLVYGNVCVKVAFALHLRSKGRKNLHSFFS